MKSPLNYQISGRDNANAALIDCLMFLFEREEMPIEILKALYAYSVECYEKGDFNEEQYSKRFIAIMSKYVSDVLRNKDLNFECAYSSKETVSLSNILYCLKNNGCACVRIWKDNDPHYVVVTGLDTSFVYVFDPHFEYASFYKNNDNVKVVLDMPFSYNRKIKLEHFIMGRQENYCMGPIQNREAVMFVKKIASQEREYE